MNNSFVGNFRLDRVARETPGDPIYREHDLENFFRQFELNGRVDQSKISAELKNGILILSLPKAEEARPRKINIHVT